MPGGWLASSWRSVCCYFVRDFCDFHRPPSMCVAAVTIVEPVNIVTEFWSGRQQSCRISWFLNAVVSLRAQRIGRHGSPNQVLNASKCRPATSRTCPPRHPGPLLSYPKKALPITAVHSAWTGRINLIAIAGDSAQMSAASRALRQRKELAMVAALQCGPDPLHVVTTER